MQRNVLLALYTMTFHIKDGVKNSLEGVSKVQKTNPGGKQDNKWFANPGRNFLVEYL